MISHLKYASIPCQNLAASLKFWTEKMGFIHNPASNPKGENWAELIIGNSATVVVLFVRPGAAGPSVTAAFACDDVGVTREQLRGRGVDVGPVRNEGTGDYAIFKDPDGYQYLHGPR